MIHECRRRRDWDFRITSHRWLWVNIYKNLTVWTLGPNTGSHALVLAWSRGIKCPGWAAQKGGPLGPQSKLRTLRQYIQSCPGTMYTCTYGTTHKKIVHKYICTRNKVRWTVTSQLYLGEPHYNILQAMVEQKQFHYTIFFAQVHLATPLHLWHTIGGSRLLHSAYRYLCPRSKRINQWSNYLAHSAIYLTLSWCTKHYSTILIAGMSEAIHSKWPKWPDVNTLWSSRCYIKKISQR